MIHLALFGVGAAGAMLLTYLLHSTLWIAGAKLLTHFHRALSASARHVVWRAALLGPLGSSAFALALGPRWQWALTSAPAAGEGGLSAAPALAPLHPLPLANPVELAGELASHSVPFHIEPAPTYTWSALLAISWAVVALAGLLLLARAVHRQRSALALRTPVTCGTSLEALERLRRRAGLRARITLSRCAQASSPLVLSSTEICLPERADGLDAAALESVLAHEIAHIERRDGLWLYAALVLQALLWFQPLNRRVRAQLQESAELAADARAVELTGDALGLARTLTVVASWLSSAEPAPLVAMARAGSLIVERVERLVEVSDARSGSRRSARTPWFALAALAAIGACSPSVGAPQASALAASEPPASPAAPSAGQASSVEPGQEPFVEPAAAPAVAVEPGGLGGQQQQAHSAGSPSAGAPSDAVASGPPNAVDFGQSVAKLALAEHRLQESILRIEQRLAAQGAASGTAAPDLESLRCELAETTANRLRLTRDFETRMKAWGKDFDARMKAWGKDFEREQKPRLAAWGKDFEARMKAWGKDFEREQRPRLDALGKDLGRSMEAMGRDLERTLGQLHSLSIPPPPVVPPPPSPPSAPLPPSVAPPPSAPLPPGAPR